jgi:hypothetical protein
MARKWTQQRVLPVHAVRVAALAIFHEGLWWRPHRIPLLGRCAPRFTLDYFTRPLLPHLIHLLDHTADGCAQYRGKYAGSSSFDRVAPTHARLFTNITPYQRHTMPTLRNCAATITFAERMDINATRPHHAVRLAAPLCNQLYSFTPSPGCLNQRRLI